MREFINAASITEVEALKKEIMRHSKKAKDAYKVAWIALSLCIAQFVLFLYLIIK